MSLTNKTQKNPKNTRFVWYFHIIDFLVFFAERGEKKKRKGEHSWYCCWAILGERRTFVWGFLNENVSSKKNIMSQYNNI